MKNLQNFYDVLFGNLVVIILIATAATLYSMFDNLNVTVKEMSKGMIKDRLSLAEEELYNIFDPIDDHLKTTKNRAHLGVFNNINDYKQLNAYFLPLLENSPSISSVMVANDLGDEYMLLRTDSVWITRITKNANISESQTQYLWRKSKIHEQTLVTSKKLENDYDPRKRPWYVKAMSNRSDSVISWTHPYTFFTTKQPGITASIKWKDTTTGRTYVFAMDVLISDLSDFTTSIELTEHGKVFILSEELEVIGLPKDERFKDKTVRNNYSLKKLSELQIPLLDKAIKDYRALSDSINFISFDFDSKVWWAGIDRFELNENKSFIVGVVVPETDFVKDIEETRHLLIGGFILTFLFFLMIIYSFIKMKQANKIIAIERDKNEQLLLNTLPIKVVNDLKENGKSDPQKFRNVTVCFSDIVGFTQISAKLDPKELINELNDIYTTFDEIMIKYDCERIKTMGDAYLSVCGMPQKNDRHAEMMLKAAIEIIEYTKERSKESKIEWKMRIGMHSGNVVGGIVGVKKYIYDVFGDTINTASRMESNSEPMHVNLSEETYQIVKDTAFVKEKKITFEKRPPVVVKGKGLMNMYFAHVSN